VLEKYSMFADAPRQPIEDGYISVCPTYPFKKNMEKFFSKEKKSTLPPERFKLFI